MSPQAWKAISLASAAFGALALLALVIVGLTTAKSGKGYTELILLVVAVVILLPLSYFSNRAGR